MSAAPTTRLVALLRGVNVGRAKRVPMADWQAQLMALGYSQVRTLLNSGNAVFTGAGADCGGHAQRVRTALLQGLGVDVPVVVKTAAQLQAIVAGNALAAVATDPSRLLVAFAADAATLQGLAGVADRVVPPDQWMLGPQAAYLWCAQGILQSAAAQALLGKAGQAVTTRNWATVLKLAALLDAPPSTRRTQP
jgi:uncharacterized protein (DUF1697 family)